jgi:CDP-6-deoxy-D-xylo-4-hexulose-3-dehydrase
MQVDSEKAIEIKEEIFSLIEKYYQEVFANKKLDSVPVSGKLFDHREMQMITESALDAWFTTGRFNKEFEERLANYIGVQHLVTVNSGSSANLVAMLTLTASELGDRAIKPGDEFITVAASFPTTVNPLLSYGAIPVFIDVDIPSYNIRASDIESAITEKTKAIVIAHTLGNPFELDKIQALCKKHNLWLVEDCCDALGSSYLDQHVGVFGDIATLSFYPAHHITMGEGGAVFTNNPKLKKIAESFRDWGRDCWCPTGVDNSCGGRFNWSLGGLPKGYDHKYIYSRLGYNLKITDMQAALGLAQLEKLDSFIEKRRHNFDRLRTGLEGLSEYLILPEACKNSKPSWFGFLISLKNKAWPKINQAEIEVKLKNGMNRNDLCRELNSRRINTRLLFAGDIRKQPYFINQNYHSHGELMNTEYIMHNTFWLGVAPLLGDDEIDYVIKNLQELVTNES